LQNGDKLIFYFFTFTQLAAVPLDICRHSIQYGIVKNFCTLSTIYSKRYDLIFVEKLNVQNMVRNRKLARSIIDSGWGYFKAMLEYKAKLVFEVNSYHTSVDCSRCGNKVAKSLAVRTHHCDKCGIVLERDHNAALNILQRGKALLGIVLPKGLGEFTPVEILCESGKQEQADGFIRG
jgi:putative transposase